MRRLAALVALALLPWTIFPTGDVVFAWGLASASPIHVTTLPDYLLVYTVGLPRRLLAWPVASGLYLLAVVSATLEHVGEGREDRRVTGGLLVLAGASLLRFSLGMSRTGYLAVPTGTALLWAAAWWFHWADLREVV